MSPSSTLVWPPFATDPTAPLIRWITGLGESQAWDSARLQAGQQRQLQALARWATDKVPYYRNPRWREPRRSDPRWRDPGCPDPRWRDPGCPDTRWRDPERRP